MGSRTNRNVKKWLFTFFQILFQSAAAGLAFLVLQRWIERLNSWWIALFAACVAAIATIMLSKREALVDSGTFIALVVPKPEPPWADQPFDAAMNWAKDNNFAHIYPVRNSGSPAAAVGNVADWRQEVLQLQAMLTLILSKDRGPDLDVRRIALCPAGPLSILFHLGAQWEDLGSGQRSCAVLASRGPERDFKPHIVSSIDPDRQGVGDLEAHDTFTECIVVLLQQSFEEKWVLKRFPGAQTVGRRILLPNAKPWQAEIDTLANEVEAHLRAVPTGKALDVILAVPAPVAFTLGWQLRASYSMVRLWEFDKVSREYFQVRLAGEL